MKPKRPTKAPRKAKPPVKRPVKHFEFRIPPDYRVVGFSRAFE